MRYSESINIKEREDSLEKVYQKLLEVGFGKGPIEEAPKFMDENVMGYGTALDEKIMSYDEFRELVFVQRKQAVNFDDFIYKSNPVLKRLFNEGNSAFIVDEIDLTSVIDGKENKMTVRMSTMLEFNKESWKVVHWHASLADHVSGGEDPWHVEEWKQKTAELQKLVDEKTVDLLHKNRELEIEASLERVRAVAMGMSKSEDLLDICEVSYHEFEKLGFENLRAVLIHILDDESKTFTDYDYCELFGGEISTLSYDSHPVVVNYFKQIKSREDAFAEAVLSGEELESWKKVRLETGQKNDPRLNDTDALYYYGYSIGFGDFSISTLKPIDETQKRILKRFRNVFDLAYRRYNDIARAEEQAREAQIEAALERVRSLALGMRKSEEVGNVTDRLFTELINLSVDVNGSSIVVIDEESDKMELWRARSNVAVKPFESTSFSESMNLLKKYMPDWFPTFFDSLRKRESYLIDELSADKRLQYINVIAEQYKYSDEEKSQLLKNTPEKITTYYIFFKLGYLALLGENRLSEENLSIARRFVEVFEFSYTRFLDIKKAESQAREAKIELALERVRARTMAMQKSEELKEVIQIVYEQFVQLNIHIEHTGFILDYKERDDMHIWLADKHEVPFEITIPYFDSPHWNSFVEAKEKGMDFFANHLTFEEKNKFYQDLFKFFPVPDESKEYYFGCPGLAISTVLLDNIGLYIENFSGIPYSDEDNNTLMRFGKVFQQTYTRFLDLKKAEAQAREAQIEAALERVRSRSMSMHKSDELADLSLELVKQVHALGVDTWFCAFNIYDDDQQGSLEWGSNGQGTFPQYRTPREGIFLRYYEAGQRGEKLFVNEINENECPAHYDYLCSLPGVGEQLLKMKEAGIPFPTSQIDHVAFFKYGYIIFITFEPALDAHDIFKRFAGVFEQTYTRFLDLQKSEEQRKIIQAENDRKTEELEEARKLQLAMLPKELPKLSKLDIAVYMQTATEVGGDYYDFSTKDDGSLNVCLGDATGHGLKAGTLVSIMKSLFVADSVRLGVQEFFNSSNETLKKMSLSQMMMAFAMVNIYGKRIKIANAGIPPIYIYRKSKNEVEEVTVNGLPIGAMKNSRYEIYENEVAAGDTILILSDGFPELQNTSDEMYGYERLRSVFKQNGNKTSKEIITVLENESKTWSGVREQDDDVTFVVINVI